MSEERFDNKALTSLLGKVGTHPVSMYDPVLSRADIEQMYRMHRHIQNVINLIPEDCTLHLPQWELESGEPKDLIAAYQDIEAFGEPMQEINIQGVFELALKYGRLYGDGFIILGINDGQDPSEPVDLKRINSVDWARAYHRHEVGIDYRKQCYLKYIDKQHRGEATEALYFHRSRVLRFPGVELFGNTFASNGTFNDSVLNAIYKQHCTYLDSVYAASKMVQSHSVFKYGFNGLGKALSNENGKRLMRDRFESIMVGLSTIGGLVHDNNTESAEFIQRNYAGVVDILKHTQELFISVTGMPRGKIFGNAAIGAMSEASEGERWEWNEIIARAQSSRLKPAQMRLTELLLAAMGKTGIEFDIKYKPHYQLTEKEHAELRFKNAQTDKMYLDLGVLSAQEVRESRFGSSDYGNSITLQGIAAPEPEPEPQQEVADPEAENENNSEEA